MLGRWARAEARANNKDRFTAHTHVHNINASNVFKSITLPFLSCRQMQIRHDAHILHPSMCASMRTAVRQSIQSITHVYIQSFIWSFVFLYIYIYIYIYIFFLLLYCFFHFCVFLVCFYCMLLHHIIQCVYVHIHKITCIIKGL